MNKHEYVERFIELEKLIANSNDKQEVQVAKKEIKDMVIKICSEDLTLMFEIDELVQEAII